MEQTPRGLDGCAVRREAHRQGQLRCPHTSSGAHDARTGLSKRPTSVLLMTHLEALQARGSGPGQLGGLIRALARPDQ